MRVIEIQRIGRYKYKISLEDGETFILYSSEIRRFHIERGEEISGPALKEIFDEVLMKRAKKRCIDLLKDMDRTERQLRERLTFDGYPEGIIECALSYVASYHYTDDARYADSYVRRMSKRKSRRMIEYELLKKGIEKDLVCSALDRVYTPPEEGKDIARGEIFKDPSVAAIRYLGRKKGYDPLRADSESSARFMHYLDRKGFSLADIKQAFDSWS